MSSFRDTQLDIAYSHQDALLWSPHVLNKILELVGLFQASRRIAEIAMVHAAERADRSGRRHSLHHPLELVHNQLFLSKATTMLTEIAIHQRVIDDFCIGENAIRNGEMMCGTLETTRRSEGLSLREACNKIIHCTEIRFETKQPDDWRKFRRHSCPIFSYSGLVILKGTTVRKVEWEARVDLELFCTHASKVCIDNLF